MQGLDETSPSRIHNLVSGASLPGGRAAAPLAVGANVSGRKFGPQFGSYAHFSTDFL